MGGLGGGDFALAATGAFLTPNALASLRQDVGRVELALSGKGGTQGTLEVKGENVKVETEQNGEFKSSKLTFSQGLFYNSYSVFITPKFASAPDQKTRERVNLEFTFTCEEALGGERAMARIGVITIDGKKVGEKLRVSSDSPFFYTQKNVKSGETLELKFTVKNSFVVRDVSFFAFFVLFGFVYLGVRHWVLQNGFLRVREFGKFASQNLSLLLFVLVLNLALLLWAKKFAFFYIFVIFGLSLGVLHLLFLWKEKAAWLGARVLFWACFVLFLVEIFCRHKLPNAL